jgi:hypothetical protein
MKVVLHGEINYDNPACHLIIEALQRMEGWMSGWA